MGTLRRSGTARAAGLRAAAGLVVAAAVLSNPNTPVVAAETTIAPPLSPEIPSDIDVQLRDSIEASAAPNWRIQVHRLFERHAWATMVALSWPVDADGAPRPDIGDAGPPRWSRWAEAFQVFKADGSPPDPWGAASRSVPDIGDIEPPRQNGTVIGFEAVPAGSSVPPIGSGDARVLHNLSSTGPLNVLDEVNQAFSSPVWDQNGNMVHYEILINEEQYAYIVENELYNVDGQIAFFRQESKLDFPRGRFGTDRKGAIELKLAWKVMDPERDDLGRYVTMPAYVPSGPGDPHWQPALMGLVGFHVAQKTESSPQWIWSTFEHVDNVEVDLLDTVTVNGEETPLLPSFNDPYCEWCPVNVVPTPDADGVSRTQVTRLVPIMATTRRLNAAMQAELAEHGSRLQYYELVGVQWPVFPELPPADPDDFPGAVTNKSGGEPFPTNLVNSVMETYSQKGNLPANRHQMAIAASDRLVFGTASCMGCHASAPSDDFSWIMIKAQPRRVQP